MNILRLPMPARRQALPAVDGAVLGWAAVVAIALLAFFVHVLHEQVQRGATLRAQFRSGERLPRTAADARLLRTAEASQLHQRRDGK